MFLTSIHQKNIGKLNQAIAPPCIASSGVQHHAPHALVDPYYHHLQYTSYQHSQNPNPNPYVLIDPIKALDYGLSPSGVDPGASASSLAHSHGGAYDPNVAYAHHLAAIYASGCYQDPNAVNALQNWAAEELRYYG
ncbi:hypothetical protein Acr_27g0009400 [Actinidia rufa]|uniref:Uncharacterized protein n=1 Tax=Actinidia rufa TaxID=165716 RepID=A0A7J0H8A4_9ERIC|nr:hypothetical protein Acr_27g0009400 [Actinidia rufa]